MPAGYARRRRVPMTFDVIASAPARGQGPLVPAKEEDEMTETMIPRTPALRAVLLADAAGGGAMGLLLAAAAGPLAVLFGLPEALLRVAGLALLPWSAWLGWLAARDLVPRAALRAVVAVNLLWVADSLLLVAGARWLGLAPSGLGFAFVLAQAVAVLGLTLAPAAALRRAAARPARA